MDNSSHSQDFVKITPIEHATMVLNFGGKTIYTDPVGGAQAFKGQPEPDLILITDVHGDHMNEETLSNISKENTVLVMPQAVNDALTQDIPGTRVILKNGETTKQLQINIEAIPMYNVPESENAFHTKGRGNGYVIEFENKRIYIAGDSADIPEMRDLKNIDIAFVPMNLPYTMNVESAADAVADFKPKVVHPYHYRGPEGLSDTQKFKKLVNEKDPNIKVKLLNFYS